MAAKSLEDGMMKRELYLRLFDNMPTRGFDLFLGEVIEGQLYAPKQPLEMAPVSDGEPMERLIFIDGHQGAGALQQLADDLWAAGIRPTQAEAGEMAFNAQARHLEDMRAIAAKQLKTPLPENMP